MQAIRNKYKGHEGEIKTDLLLYGESPTAEKWGQKPTLAWHEYCKNIMGDEPFSYVTEVITKSDDAIIKDVAIEIINQILRVAAENQQMSYLIRTPEMWGFDEVSTRNCIHTRVDGSTKYPSVRCAINDTLLGSYNGIVCLPRLLKACLNCDKFSNDWR